MFPDWRVMASLKTLRRWLPVLNLGVEGSKHLSCVRKHLIAIGLPGDDEHICFIVLVLGVDVRTFLVLAGSRSRSSDASPGLHSNGLVHKYG